MKKKEKTTAILLAVIVSASLLSACSSFGSKDGSSGLIPTPRTESAPSSAPMGPNDVDAYDYGIPYESQIDRNSGSKSALSEETYELGGSYNEASDISSGAEAVDPIAETGALAEKIIYTANADIETVDFDDTIGKVDDMLGLYGAFIENSYVGGRNYAQSYYGYQTYRTASYTLRVPKDRFEAMKGNLDTLGNVTSLQTNADNITAQFLDTESRLNSYKIQEERLLAMLEQADTVADMITIETRLADVRYDIESLTSSLKNWQNQVDYSTLTLSIREVEKYTETTPIQQTYWEQIGDGLQTTTRGVGEFFTNVFKWIVITLPVFAVLVVVAAIVLIIVRVSINKKRKSNKNVMH